MFQYDDNNAFNKVKQLSDTINAIAKKTSDHLFWIAQYKVLLNQLKSRNHNGTAEQLDSAIASLIQEAEELLSR